MKKSKFTDERVAFALKPAEVGTPEEVVCSKMGISDATFYNWQKKYGGLGPFGVEAAPVFVPALTGNFRLL